MPKSAKKGNRRKKAKGNSLNAGLPKPSSAGQTSLKYNPTWNPQALKVMREFQYSSPPVDFAGGFGIIQDPSVGALTTTLSYASGAISFRVSDVYNVSEFGNLFDQYRIHTVKLKFDYITASSSVLTPTVTQPTQVGTLLLYEDFDDSTAPTATNAGWQACMESGRAIRKYFPSPKGNSVSYTVRPKYLTVDVDNSGGTTGRSLGSGWVDGATSPEVIWRGIKWIAQCNPGNVNTIHYWRVTAFYYLQFRNRQ